MIIGGKVIGFYSPPVWIPQGLDRSPYPEIISEVLPLVKMTGIDVKRGGLESPYDRYSKNLLEEIFIIMSEIHGETVTL